MQSPHSFNLRIEDTLVLRRDHWACFELLVNSNKDLASFLVLCHPQYPCECCLVHAERFCWECVVMPDLTTGCRIKILGIEISEVLLHHVRQCPAKALPLIHMLVRGWFAHRDTFHCHVTASSDEPVLTRAGCCMKQVNSRSTWRVKADVKKSC
jgi:hypothetical protein